MKQNPARMKQPRKTAAQKSSNIHAVNPQEKTVILIVGPTAVGKTRFALTIARHFNTEIISADSRQCYREMNIGVARPSEAELAEVPHHFIASHSIHSPVNAAWFENFALKKTEELFLKNDVVVMVGGTGLYIKAFVDGLDSIPEINAKVRNEVIREYEEKGLNGLLEELRHLDPGFVENGEIMNPHRVMRALEVVRATGHSIRSFQKGTVAQRPFKVKTIGLELPRQELYDHINLRVDKMVEAGLEKEARALYPYRHLPALQTVGYQEWFEFFEGKITREAAIGLIKQHTRNYAKRQMTWFKKMEGVHWVDARLPIDVAKIIS